MLADLTQQIKIIVTLLLQSSRKSGQLKAILLKGEINYYQAKIKLFFILF